MPKLLSIILIIGMQACSILADIQDGGTKIVFFFFFLTKIKNLLFGFVRFSLLCVEKKLHQSIMHTKNCVNLFRSKEVLL